MIITRTPLRISFAGGGSDQAAFYREEPGCVVSATIDKYIYLTVDEHYDKALRVSYSVTEHAEKAAQIEHPLVRACLQMANIRSGVEITSHANVPSGTGLGSSSAFTVGLLRALYAYQGEFHTADSIAHDACHVEIEMCHAPIGKQDQYAAAFGGLRSYTFQPDNLVSVEQIAIPTDALDLFQSRLLLLDTGIRRNANTILSGQQSDMRDSRKRANVRTMVNLALAFKDSLQAGRFDECGEILHSAWQLKRHFSGASNEQIDAWYDAARKAGAIGGKVCGAGGGGMLLFYANEEKHAEIVRSLGLRRIPFQFSRQGSAVIYAD